MSARQTSASPLDAGIPSRTSDARPRRRLRARLRLPLMLLAPVAVIAGGTYMYATGGRYVGTDDAYVQAARVSVSTDVSARVVEIDVTDNAMVKAGDVLFRLDRRPLDIAVENARAALAAARLQVQATLATYGQRQADARAAQDTLDYQQQEYNRQKRLLGSGIASQAQFDQTNHALAAARQSVAAAQQQIASVLADIGGAPDLPIDRHPSVQQAQATLDRAELNASYATVRAPLDGMVTKVDQLQVGNFVTAGVPVFSLVATTAPWIEANFKETDLTHMRVGQTATVVIDTYPDTVFTARVASLSPGTGSTFALLPAENSTGNWVKVVQRLPVRFTLEGLPADAPLHAGLSADVTVDTGFRRKLLTTINAAFGAEAAK